MKRIAVVGSGISGLAAAYFLSRRHEVHLFEKDGRLGGHTHTVVVDSSRGPLPVDTGFIVHNDRTYPNLVRLFNELGVETQPSDMSFAVACRRTGLEYSSRGANGFLAQRRNLLRPGHYRLFLDILRFNRTAPALLDDPEAAGLTLGEYLERERYGEEFTAHYLFPMASAIWSASFDAIRTFPAVTLIRFFDNHGMLGVNPHPQWKVVRGGSHQYIPYLTAPYRSRVHAGVEISAIDRGGAAVTIRFAGRPAMVFDEVVIACHGDEVLPLLARPTDAEREVFASFATTRNETWLHTDGSVLPTRAPARASWNYLLGESEAAAPSVTYHMNRLQSLPVDEDYCVTLNPGGRVDDAKVLKKMVYRHPLYSLEAIRAQARWREVSGRNRTHYCGAYWFYGFHEDGLSSALRVARDLGVEW